ncbi:C39 family peptidase, partial [candidate division KSB1 bacterium]|nr:C39 family peptidase [candidate division KSB1 bacterium]
MLFTQRRRYLIGIWGLLVFGGGLQAREMTLQMPRPTPQTNRIVVANPDLNRLYLVELNQTPRVSLLDSACAVQRINWSADQHYLAFKRFEHHLDGEILQAPVVYVINSGRIEVLHDPVAQAGVPSFSRDGNLAFTIGEKLLLLDATFKLKRTYRLGHYANLAPISPDGRAVIFNDREDQLWILDLPTGAKSKLTADRQGYAEPLWSPDSRHIAARTLAGQLVIWHLPTRTEIVLETGDTPGWSPDGAWLFYRQVNWNQRLEMVGAEIMAVRDDGSQRTALTATPMLFEAEPQLTHHGEALWYTELQTAQLFHAKLDWRNGTPQIVELKSEPLPQIEMGPSNSAARPEIQMLSPASVYFEAPYLHQVYDTPDWFNGHWACGATSAMMGLAYYEILPPWPCTCSSPRTHTSDFGRYISDTYTFNRYTYNIAGADASGQPATGGYGFIIQNDWADTRGYMAQYIRQHGLGSEVDWAPTQAKARKEVQQQFPFVLLNSLTNSGHYILTVGYDSARNALIVNDPYGNKNYGYMNYLGKQAIYDWPGYYSGHSNLNTVHCFIYMRQAADLLATNMVVPDTVGLGASLEVRATLQNQGIRPATAFSYGWYWMNYYPAIPSTPPQWQGEIADLNPGDSIMVAGKVVVPDSIPSRRYGIGIWVDPTNLQSEMSEANNFKYALTVVRGYPTLTVGYPVASSLIRTG